jgi:cobalt/nickel transport system permease protein
VAYLQASDPALLRNTSGLAETLPFVSQATPRKSLRRLWVAVALLMLLTPLGILAAGKAWGEWSAAEFSSASGQARIAAASQDASAPERVPTGLQKLSSAWTAPIPAYAPQFVKSRSFGYLLSAMFGVGLLMASSLAIQSLLQWRRATGQPG